MLVIKELGGTVHYSEEFRLYLSTLPRQKAEQIVAEIEYHHRRRRIWVDDGIVSVAAYQEDSGERDQDESK
jgi:hypothetical protein